MSTLTSAGAVTTDPTVIRDELVAVATTLSPGLTANLPGSLVEDMASTAAGAAVIQDQAYVDLINSISPYTANAFLLYQLGAVYGVERGIGANTSVYVTFIGDAGFVIPVGFTVSDGTHQYTVQDGGIIGTSGQSAALYCLAVQQGSWAVPVGTVTQVVTSIPSGITVTCTNQVTGVPGQAAQTLQAYQAQVIQAGQAVCQGTPTLLKTLLGRISGVQQRLIAIKASGDLYTIIVGGGDPYEVANAIFKGLFDLGDLIGSVLLATSITKANPGVVTTNLNHGYATGQVIQISGSAVTAYNGTYTITVLSETTFSLGVNTTSYATYTGGGVVTPNLRNITVSINDYPDTYQITFVSPPQQTVNIALTWNTTSTNYVSPTAVAQLGQPALANYINSIYVGQPINVFELQNVFQTAIAAVIPPPLLSRMVFTVAINGIDVPPDAGTGLIYGDPESYFETNNASIVITQG